MTIELKEKLIFLADKYENKSFPSADPCQFLRWYPLEDRVDVEIASFIAAMLAFGSRSQFIPKIKELLNLADRTNHSISEWIKAGSYKKTFIPADSSQKNIKRFYRFYSYTDMQDLFDEIAEILKQAPSLGDYFQQQWLKQKENNCKLLLADIISQAFPRSKIVAKGKNSANKRIHMFLRWMVRQNSPVDLGFWSWYPQSELLIPLDLHVMQEAEKLGLLPAKVNASRKTALLLTEELKEAFPKDPCRGDYALFGLGVDRE